MLFVDRCAKCHAGRYYVLVAILRERLDIEMSLYQILSLTLFEKVPILQALETLDSRESLIADPNQLILFNL
ncbi:MAG: hypothetical protein AUF67_08750 [Acidobacteria bacterium 13_1_20CM_58_21]|nr:MAG: hypothetical protein AUF67_08750 [Acidobacteria bacterium 13_1_20CM_58_21]